MRRTVLVIAAVVLAQTVFAQSGRLFSNFAIKFNYNIGQPALTSINDDIFAVDGYFLSGDWSRDLQAGQDTEGGDRFESPLLLHTSRFQNTPSFAARVEANVGLLWYFGLEYSQGGVSAHGYHAYAPGGENDGYVKRRETLNYTSTLLYGRFQIRDRNLPLFAYVGAGGGYTTLQVEGLYRMGNKFNADYMQEWLEFTNDHNGSALAARGFLGMEYRLTGFGHLFLECGYNYQNVGSVDGSTELRINNPYLPNNYDMDPDNDISEYYGMDGVRPATLDFVYDFIYWWEDADDDYRYDPGEETDTFTGVDPFAGTYNGGTIDFDLSGFYFNVGLGFSF